MPIDEKRRSDDLARALTLMVEAQGDAPLNEMAFDPSQARFQELIPTTWSELCDKGLIEERGEKPGPSFRLTARGWLAGLGRSGALDCREIRDRAIAMRRRLKARVKGRGEPDGATVDVRVFAEEVGVPVGWVWNALRANLLQAVFPDDLMNASLDPTHQLAVRIPPTFDMKMSK